MANEDSRTLGSLYRDTAPPRQPSLPSGAGSSIGDAYQSWFEASQEQQWLEAIEERRSLANSDHTQVIDRAEIRSYQQAMQAEREWDDDADNAVDVAGGRTLRERRAGASSLSSAQPSAPADEAAAQAGGGSASILRSSALMASGTLVSRVLGLVRASLTISALGTATHVANTWSTANTIPNIIYLLLAGGVINAVLVPQITRALEHSDGGKSYTDRIVTLSLTLLLAVTAVGMLAAPWVYQIYDSENVTGDKLHVAWAFTLICLPQVFFYGIYTVFGQVLNARSRFGAFMWSPALANIVIIIGLVWFIAAYPHGQRFVPDYGGWNTEMILILALPATLGIVVQALALVPALKRSGYSFTPNFKFRGVGLRSASTMAGWAFAAVILQQAGLIVTSQLLNSQPKGQPGKAAQDSAFLLFTLPHSLITLSLVTALFTRMAVAAGRGETQKVKADMTTGIRLSGLASVMLTFGSFALVFPLVGTLFPDNASGVWPIGSFAVSMMVGLVPYSLCLIIQRVFYAYNDAKTPFWMQLICTSVAMLLTIPWFFLQDTTILGHPGMHWIGVGVGMAQTLSNVVQAAVGYVWLRRRLGHIEMGDTVRTYVRLSVAAILATLVAGGIVALLGNPVSSGRFTAMLVLVASGVPFLAVYIAVAKRLHVTEINQMIAPITRRLAR